MGRRCPPFRQGEGRDQIIGVGCVHRYVMPPMAPQTEELLTNTVTHWLYASCAYIRFIPTKNRQSTTSSPRSDSKSIPYPQIGATNQMLIGNRVRLHTYSRKATRIRLYVYPATHFSILRRHRLVVSQLREPIKSPQVGDELLIQS